MAQRRESSQRSPKADALGYKSLTKKEGSLPVVVEKNDKVEDDDFDRKIEGG